MSLVGHLHQRVRSALLRSEGKRPPSLKGHQGGAAMGAAWMEAAAWEEQEEAAWEGPLVVAAWEEEAVLTGRTGEATLLRVLLLFRAAGNLQSIPCL